MLLVNYELNRTHIFLWGTEESINIITVHPGLADARFEREAKILVS